MKLTDIEKQEVELVWNGKTNEVVNIFGNDIAKWKNKRNGI